MTYKLIIGNRTYSSWSLRGWLLLENFGLPYDTQMVDFSTRDTAHQLRDHPPARTVPTLVTDDGAVICETLSIAEELATRHPDAGLWPADPTSRATARTLTAEMATGFSALRTQCPMNLGTAYANTGIDVAGDLRRLETIWARARATTGSNTSWLCGEYCAADAFFAPVAARIAGYGLAVSDDAHAYVAAHLADPAFRRWRAMGLAHGQVLTRYKRDYEQTSWPGPALIPARAVANGPAENDYCPYSQKPVTDFAQINDRIFGFCNSFCRDKTVNDPAAWPQFMAM